MRRAPAVPEDRPALQPKRNYPVPSTAAGREALRRSAEAWVKREGLIPPLTLAELTDHATALAAAEGFLPTVIPFLTVLVGNALWRERIAAIPYERRILLLPQCLREKARCPAEIDAFGLLCENCGACPTGALVAEAEALGTVVLVAEGSTVVASLLAQGKVDAVIGVSCLLALEKTFGAMAREAIPGLAIPLCRDGCDATEVDLAWVREAMSARSEETWRPRADLETLEQQVQGWFAPSALAEGLASVRVKPTTQVESLATTWLARDGKRWRPILLAAVADALDPTLGLDALALRRAALAVECFHKASLIHDDIEDGDELRYGRMTLHREHGVPIALNVGDLLIGWGYRLIAEAGLAPEVAAAMLRIAAEGHCTLCLGQGEELAWMREPVPLSVRKTLEIFTHKTAPAFSVALRIGALFARESEALLPHLASFSEHLGVAYQIRDDLDDWTDAEGSDLHAARPSLLLALAYERSGGELRERIAAAWSQGLAGRAARANLLAELTALAIPAEAGALLLVEKERALAALRPILSVDLKSLLHRLSNRILP